MIAKLRGLLDSFAADHAVIDVNGIGYLVFASSRTLSALGATGSEVVVHTEHRKIILMAWRPRANFGIEGGKGQARLVNPPAQRPFSA